MSTDELPPKHDCGEDAAAYVLGALEREEAAAYRDHLETCVVCRDEVRALQAVADALPMSAPQLIAPRSLRRNVMRLVRAEAREGAGARRPGGFPSFSLGAPRLALAGLAAAAAIVITLIAIAPGGSSSTHVVPASVPGSSAFATLRVTGTRGELTLERMPQPPSGRIYEVWLKRTDQPPVPTSTLFSVTANGSATVGVPGNLRGVNQVLVTPEPFGGSAAPTHAPVIIAQVPRL